MDIEIIAIGEEVLKGSIINTNSAFLSQALFQKGWKVSRHTALPDEIHLLQRGLKEALERSSIVITTGGLGATFDDSTKQAASHLFSTKPQILTNPAGQEPGLIYENEKNSLILLPGVPYEMQVIFLQSVIPFLENKIPAKEQRKKENIHFCVLSENMLDPLLRELQNTYPQMEFGIYPDYGKVTICLIGSDALQIEACKNKLLQAFPSHHYSSPSGKVEEAIQTEFIARKKTLACAESITGGLISAKIVAIPGASNYFLGSLVVYANEWKQNLLQVKPSTLEKYGAVSKEAVHEMLDGLFKVTQADFGIAVSGIAGPTGGSTQKPVGTVWFALGEKGKEPDIWTFQAKWDREKNILFTCGKALGAIYRKIAYNQTPV